MLVIEGVYQNGQVLLQKKVNFTQQIKVIVTFLEEPKEKIILDNFSFTQSREVLKDLKSSLSDGVIEERRDCST